MKNRINNEKIYNILVFIACIIFTTLAYIRTFSIPLYKRFSIILVMVYSIIIMIIFLKKILDVSNIVFISWIIILVMSIFGNSIGIGMIWIDIIISTYIIFVLSLIFFKKISFNNKFKNHKFHFIFFILWLTYAIVSIIWSKNIKYATEHINYILLAICYIFISTIVINSENKCKILLNSIFITYIFLCFIAIFEVITAFHLSSSRLVTIPYKEMILHVPTSTFYNRNDFATFLTLFSPINILFIKKNNNKIKFLSAALFIVSLYLILLTSSRLNMFAIIFLLLMIIIIHIIKHKKIKAFYILILALYILVCFTNVGTYLPYSSKYKYINIEQNQQKYEQYETNKGKISSDNIRINLLKNGLLMLKHSYYLGVGAGNLEEYMEDYQIFNDTDNIINIHNFWFEILVDYGLIVFLFLLYFCINIMINLFWIYNNSEENSIQYTTLIIMAGCIIFSISSNSPSSVIHFSFIWIFFAWILIFINNFAIKGVFNDR